VPRLRRDLLRVGPSKKTSTSTSTSTLVSGDYVAVQVTEGGTTASLAGDVLFRLALRRHAKVTFDLLLGLGQHP